VPEDRRTRRTRQGLATRDAIIDAAERLIAERGLAGVTLRDISLAANQRNRSATQYYFASLDDLANAVMDRRVVTLEQHYSSILHDLELSGRAHDIRALVEALVLPPCRMVGDSGWYFRFAAQFFYTPGIGERIDLHLVPELNDVTKTERLLVDWSSRIEPELNFLPEAVRTRRIQISLTVIGHTLASYEAQIDKDPGSVNPPFLATTLVDAITGMLTAPDSSEGSTTY
jgi:AcrR family transcriptional regulator